MKSSTQQGLAIFKELRDGLLNIRTTLSGLRDAVERQTSAVDKVRETAEKQRQATAMEAELYLPETDQVDSRRTRVERRWLGRATAVLEVLTLVAVVCYAWEAHRQSRQMKDASDAAKSAAETAASQLVLTQRPWIKITHRILSPLTFNVPGNGGQIDSMAVEDTLENVGNSVALHIFSWEDVIPIDEDYSLRTARARQDEWCNSNRHRDTSEHSGYVLFPKDSFRQTSQIGGEMQTVNRMAKLNKIVPGKVGFVLVGCVAYRSSFEPETAPAHETKFIYRLAERPHGAIEGPVQPFVVPTGVAGKLQLVAFPDGFSAD
jgi:hypothetical protein